MINFERFKAGYTLLFFDLSQYVRFCKLTLPKICLIRNAELCKNLKM